MLIIINWANILPLPVGILTDCVIGFGGFFQQMNDQFVIDQIWIGVPNSTFAMIQAFQAVRIIQHYLVDQEIDREMLFLAGNCNLGLVISNVGWHIVNHGLLMVG